MVCDLSLPRVLGESSGSAQAQQSQEQSALGKPLGTESQPGTRESVVLEWQELNKYTTG